MRRAITIPASTRASTIPTSCSRSRTAAVPTSRTKPQRPRHEPQAEDSMTTASRILVSPALLAVFVACGTEPDKTVFAIQADRFDGAEWSEPVNLGPVVNSSALDGNAGLSTDGLTLYFVSARAGGLGNNDIWMSHRQC